MVTAVQVADYEKGLLVTATWRLARGNDVNELLAIACTIRNWVVPGFFSSIARQPMNGKFFFASYNEAVEVFLAHYPARAMPGASEPALVDPDEGLLVKIDDIYSCALPDMTSSRSFPGGARYFGHAGSAESWFRAEVLARSAEHPLIGTFGGQQFYA